MTKIVPLAGLASPDPVDAGNGNEFDVDGSLRKLRGGAISIGNFDGVHLGHRSLLRNLRRLADHVGGPAIAVALDPHPAAILRPEVAPAMLTTIRRRAELMAPLGIDALVVCETSGNLLKLTARQFYDVLVRNTLDARGMIEGPNFYFGRDRGGDVQTLRRWCHADDIELQIATSASVAGEMVSSTRIRGAIRRGDLETANELLTQPYCITGRVINGAGRGRKIGFPTANLSSVRTLVPAPGVYAGMVGLVSGSTTAIHQAAIHIGPNPTFDNDRSTKIEVHLIDYDGDLYDREISVDVVSRVRDIIKFTSADQLTEQLGHDVQKIRDLLAGH